MLRPLTSCMHSCDQLAITVTRKLCKVDLLIRKSAVWGMGKGPSCSRRTGRILTDSPPLRTDRKAWSQDADTCQLRKTKSYARPGRVLAKGKLPRHETPNSDRRRSHAAEYCAGSAAKRRLLSGSCNINLRYLAAQASLQKARSVCLFQQGA